MYTHSRSMSWATNAPPLAGSQIQNSTPGWGSTAARRSADRWTITKLWMRCGPSASIPVERRTGLDAPSQASSHRLVTTVPPCGPSTCETTVATSCSQDRQVCWYRTGIPRSASSSHRSGSSRCWERLRSGVGVTARFSSPCRS